MDKILGVIPNTDYATTPVFVGATAGMRILKYARVYLLFCSICVLYALALTCQNFGWEQGRPVRALGDA